MKLSFHILNRTGVSRRACAPNPHELPLETLEPDDHELGAFEDQLIDESDKQKGKEVYDAKPLLTRFEKWQQQYAINHSSGIRNQGINE